MTTTKTQPRNWYRMAIKGADQAEAELFIYGDIGMSWWDDTAVTAKAFIDELNALPDSVMTTQVRINSLGGDVFEAVAITNAMRAWRQKKEGRVVNVSIEGIAASAATIVAMVGDKVSIADNAMFMVHNPWTIGIGNAADFRKLADDLDKVRDTIVVTYQWQSKLSTEELIALMDAETWMSADEALEKGFVTDIVEGLRAAAKLDRSVNKKVKVPEKFKSSVEALLKQEPSAPPAASATDEMRMCREASVPIDVAEDLVSGGATVDQVTARVNDEKARRAAATKRETDIRALCTNARLNKLADGFVASAMTLDQVRDQLAFVTAYRDNVEIDTTLDADEPIRNRPAASPINAREIYLVRNGQTTTASKEK